MQTAMLGVLLGLLILYFVFYYFKNKKERENYKNTIENIKKGDMVLTSAGIVGKVLSIQEDNGMKTVTIETGNSKNKGYLTFDIQAIYMVLNSMEEKEKSIVETISDNAEFNEEKNNNIELERLEPQEIKPNKKQKNNKK